MMRDVDLWRCPVCHHALPQSDAGFRCELGHTYDLAKQGYVNLLLANKKKSKAPGDSKEMVASRQDFLQRGHYDFLVEALTPLLSTLSGQSVIDLGCGEGFYLRQLSQALSDQQNTYWGIDISKSAVRRAASQSPHVNFAVASSVEIPAVSNCVDIVICVFAPFSSAEVIRVMKPGGRFIRVSPGPSHLQQLKQQLYATAVPHAQPKPVESGRLVSEQVVKHTASLDNASLQSLIGMTPLNWCGDNAAKIALLSRESFEVDFDFIVQEMNFDG